MAGYTQNYKIVFDPDMSNIKNALLKELPKYLDKIQDNSITFHFDFENAKSIQAELDKILSQMDPSLEPQFRFEIDKNLVKMAEEQLATLREKFNVLSEDNDNTSPYLNNLQLQIKNTEDFIQELQVQMNELISKGAKESGFELVGLKEAKEDAEAAKLKIKELENEIEKSTGFNTINNFDFENIVKILNDISKALGVIDDDSNLQPLIQQFNTLAQSIENSLEKLEKLEGFNFNIDFNLGSGKNQIQRNAEYGSAASNTISQLKEQIYSINDALQSLYGKNDVLLNVEQLFRATSVYPRNTTDFLKNFDAALTGNDSLISQMRTLKQIIDDVLKAGNEKGIDLSSIISIDANKIVSDTEKIMTGENEIKESGEQFLNLLQSSNSVDLQPIIESLTSIISKLTEINTLLSNNLQIKITDSSNIDETTNSLNAEAEAINNVNEANNSNQKTEKELATEHNKEAVKSYEDLYAATKKYIQLRDRSLNGGVDPISEQPFLDEYEKSLNDARNAAGKFSKALNGTKESEQEVENEQKKLNSVNEEYEFILKQFIAKNQEAYESLTINPKNKEYIKDYYNNLEILNNKIKEFQDYVNHNNLDILSDDQLKIINQYKQEILSLQKLLKQQTSNTDIQLANPVKLRGDLKDLQDYLNRNDNLKFNAKDIYKEFQLLEQDYEAGLQKDSQITVQDLKKLEARLKELQYQAGKSGATGESFLTKVSKRIKDVNSKFLATFFSWQDWIRYAREAFEVIENIDSALIELKKVSNASGTQLKEALQSATDTAKELGSTIEDIVSMQADWSRLGYSVSESEDLARTTQLLVNVGDNLDAETASEYLISTMQGFGIAAENAESIVDKYNEVANNFAIDTEGIGEALENSAASFNAANTDLSESIALVTTANAVVQDPSSVGTTFKTLSARIRGASTELSDLGEEEDEFTQTTSKLRDLVKGLTGFDIMKDENTFKSIYEILLGIGKEWKNLSDIEQASLGEALAGKRNANTLYAVLDNIDQLEEAYTTAENSAGSAAKEEENYTEGLQYSIQSLKATFEDFLQTLGNSDAIKFLIDSANTLLELLNQVLSNFDMIAPALVSIVTIVAKFKGFDVLQRTSKVISEITSQIKNVPNLLKSTITTFDIAKRELNEAELTNVNKFSEMLIGKKSFNSIDLSNKNQINDLADNIGNIPPEVREAALALDGSEESIQNFKKACASGTTGVNTFKGGLLSLAKTTFIVAGITAVVDVIYQLIAAEKAFKSNSQSFGQELSELSKSFDEYSSSIQEQYDILNDSTSSLEEQINARKELLSIQNELIDNYGTEAGAIDLISNKNNSYNKTLQDSIDIQKTNISQIKKEKNDLENQLKSSSISDKFVDLLSNYINYYTESQIEYAESNIELSNALTGAISNSINDINYSQIESVAQNIGTTVGDIFNANFSRAYLNEVKNNPNNYQKYSLQEYIVKNQPNEFTLDDEQQVEDLFKQLKVAFAANSRVFYKSVIGSLNSIKDMANQTIEDVAQIQLEQQTDNIVSIEESSEAIKNNSKEIVNNTAQFETEKQIGSIQSIKESSELINENVKQTAIDLNQIQLEQQEDKTESIAESSKLIKDNISSTVENSNQLSRELKNLNSSVDATNLLKNNINNVVDDVKNINWSKSFEYFTDGRFVQDILVGVNSTIVTTSDILKESASTYSELQQYNIDAENQGYEKVSDDFEDALNNASEASDNYAQIQLDNAKASQESVQATATVVKNISSDLVDAYQITLQQEQETQNATTDAISNLIAESKAKKEAAQRQAELNAEISNAQQEYIKSKGIYDDLNDIQNDLVGKYGTAADSIDLLSQSATTASEALRQMYLDEYDKTVNQYNYENNGFWNSIANWWKTGQFGLTPEEVAKLNYQNGILTGGGDVSISVDISDALKNSNIKSYVENLGMGTNGEYISTYNLGNTSEQLAAVNKLKNYIEQLNTSGQYDDSIRSLEKYSSQLQEIVDDYKEINDASTLKSIYSDDAVNQVYSDLTNAYDNWESAQEEGNSELASMYKEEFDQLMTNVDGLTDDQIQYFKDKFSGLSGDLDQYQFFNDSSSLSNVIKQVDTLQNKAQEITNNKHISIEEALDLTTTDDELQTTISDLEQIASINGFDNATEMITDLREMGKVSINTLEAEQQIDYLYNLLGDSCEGYVDTIVGYNNTTKTSTMLTDEFAHQLRLAIANSDNGQISFNQFEKILNDVAESLAKTNNELADMSKLSTASSNLDDLSSAYDEWQEKGFVTAETLTSLEEAWSSLSGFPTFEEIVGDPESSSEEIQQAFDELVTEYLNGIDILDDVTEETKSTYIANLKDMGISNAEEVVNSYLQYGTALSAAIDQVNEFVDAIPDGTSATQQQTEAFLNEKLALDEDTASLVAYEIANAEVSNYRDINALYDSVNGLLDEAGASEVTKMALLDLVAEQTIFNNSTLDVSQKLAALQSLSSEAGMTLIALKAIDNIQSSWSQYQKANASSGRYKNYAEFEQAYYEEAYDRAVQEWENDIKNAGNTVSTTLDHYTGAASDAADSASDSAEDAADDIKSLLDDQITYLEKCLDDGLIDYNDYVNKRRQLLEDYYRNGLITAEDYYSELSSLYQSQLDYMDKTISAVTHYIDEQIDDLEDQKEYIEDYYNAQIDALEEQQKAIENQQDALEKQKDTLNDQKDALEEANEEREQAISLQKAQYNLERAESQRSVLTYKDGQMVYSTNTSDIRDARDELDDAEYDAKVSAIDKQIDALDDQIDALDDQIDALDDQIEILNDQMQAATDAIDKQIDALNDYKDKWSEVSSVYDNKMNEIIATSMLGSDWHEQVMAGNTTLLDNFTSFYTATQQNMADVEAVTAGVTADSALQEVLALDSVSGSVTTLKTNWDNLSSDMGKGISTNIYVGLTGPGAKYLGKFNFQASGTVGAAFAEGTVGNAYASGYPGLKHNENALTSEYGQDELIVYPDGRYEVTSEPTLQRLPKDTVIFNEEQTHRIMKNGGKSGNAFAEGNAKFLPLSLDEQAQYQKISSMLVGVNTISTGVNEVVKSLNKLNAQINASVNLPSQVATAPSYTFNGGITVNCPGVTSTEVAKNLPSALESAFRGLSLNAYQQTMKK